MTPRLKGRTTSSPSPSTTRRVLARVEAQLRRYKQFSGGGGSAVLTHGDLTLDREGVTVTAAGKPVTVTAREFDILTLLMEHPKKVFTREQLYEQVWGGEYMGDDNTVNVHISNLRAKLAKEPAPPKYIQDGVGHRL
ncbi:MAG: winged helix-turn-helix domain-containing protein [Flavonifractor plautii]